YLPEIEVYKYDLNQRLPVITSSNSFIDDKGVREFCPNYDNRIKCVQSEITTTIITENVDHSATYFVFVVCLKRRESAVDQRWTGKLV
ncbi:hypothetical protein GJ496_011038, partial [Pomphorhynchus laevis]